MKGLRAGTNESLHLSSLMQLELPCVTRHQPIGLQCFRRGDMTLVLRRRALSLRDWSSRLILILEVLELALR